MANIEKIHQQIEKINRELSDPKISPEDRIFKQNCLNSFINSTNACNLFQNISFFSNLLSNRFLI